MPTLERTYERSFARIFYSRCDSDVRESKEMISMTNPETKAAKHLEDFLELSCGELKFFLQQRAIPVGGTHSDLAARALVAFEQNIPIKQSAEDLAKGLRNEHTMLLKSFDIQQDPLEIKEWNTDLTSWPKVDIGNIFSYILEKKAFSTEYIGQYKIRKAYSHFKSGFVHEVVSSSTQTGNIILFSSVTPSTRIREQPHKVWVVCKPTGDILCGYCSCTAGYSKCCNHVIAVLYKVEYANQHGLTNPSCTDVACYWNSSSKKDIGPTRIKDMNLQAHKLERPTSSRSLNGSSKQEFDARPLAMRNISKEDKQVFLTSVRRTLPDAVLNITYSPPSEEDVPPTLPEIADKVLSMANSKEECELASSFSQCLSFNDSSIKELEKATRGQSMSRQWIQQRQGRITASNFHDVYTKVKTLLRQRGKEVKTKVTPLLAKLIEPKDLSNIPAIKWGRLHEKDASKALFTSLAKVHSNPKLHTCGLFILKPHPYIGASPDNIFSCSCCGSSCVEYKCPYSIKDLEVEEGYEKTDFLEKCEGQLQLKRNNKYFYQVQGQMALTGHQTTYFVVWTLKGQPLIEKIAFDQHLWQDVVSKLVIFFKGYVQRVLLGLRPLCFCSVCEKPCLEPDEFESGDNKESVQCDFCQIWCHCICVGKSFSDEDTFICASCNKIAKDL